MMGRQAVIVSARRTPVAPRGGSLSHLQADELAAPVLRQLLTDTGLDGRDVGHVILGNALYGGGNPARLAALSAGLPETVPALTLDTQCCSGLDAIILGARLIEAGAADCVLAGGTESFSRAPLRMHRPQQLGTEPVAYLRPRFAPPPFADPDLTEAAAGLAAREAISRETQADFAVLSHEKALAAASILNGRLVPCPGGGPLKDSFARQLTRRTAMKAPLLAGATATGLSAATIACEADAAAAVLLLSKDRAKALKLGGLAITGAASLGGDPAEPALVPVALGRVLLKGSSGPVADYHAVEIHEAYAVQAMATATALSIPADCLNPLGGGLARGHPIGASGAILACQLFDAALTKKPASKHAVFTGMALIAAAGGLAAGMRVSAVPA